MTRKSLVHGVAEASFAGLMNVHVRRVLKMQTGQRCKDDTLTNPSGQSTTCQKDVTILSQAGTRVLHSREGNEIPLSLGQL